MGSVHRPVLIDEIAARLEVVERPGAILVDGTAGGGGHLIAMARLLGPGGKEIGLDRDPKMLALALEAVRDAGVADRVTLVHAAYSQMKEVLEQLGIEGVDAIILDLGLSSDQLAWQDRGFSFASDGPLDMRFDPDEDVRSAADLVNELGETDLANVFFELGEERYNRRIAAGWSKSGRRNRSGRPDSLPRSCGEPFRAMLGTDISTRRRGSSRRCGSRSTTNWASSTLPWRRFPACFCPAGGLPSSASIRWKTVA